MVAIAAIVLVHLGLIIALKSGLARKVVDTVIPPLKVDIVKEEIVPEKEPPPPAVNIETPPPFVPAPEINIEFPPEPAPTITTTTTPPPEPSAPVRAPPVISRTAPGTPSSGLSKPDYPPVSRRLGQEGTVVLQLYILETGRVGDAKVERTSGFPKLDEAAVAHAKKAWRFKPATENGKAVPIWFSFRVKFTLDDYQ
jgi:protein TonB